MSKKNKYGNIDPEDLMRYSTDGLSDEERHALERETQKDPFVEEAIEGFSSLKADQAVEDLSRLQSRLKRRISGRGSMVWVRIAASVAVILTLGTLYFTVFTDKLGKLDQTVAESESVEPAGEKGVPEELRTKDEVEIKEAFVPEETATPEIEEATGEQEETSVPETSDGAGGRTGSDDEIETEEPVVETISSETVGQMDAESDMEAELIVADSQPNDKFLMEDMAQARQLEGVAANEGTTMDAPRALAKKDSRSKSGVVVSSVQMLPDSIPALPDGGMESFNRYIEENIRYPDGDLLPANAVVVLTFDINNEGQPEKIEVEESPGDAFSMEAIRLLQEGPAWSPAFNDGRPDVKRNRLKIEFTRN